MIIHLTIKSQFFNFKRVCILQEKRTKKQATNGPEQLYQHKPTKNLINKPTALVSNNNPFYVVIVHQILSSGEYSIRGLPA